MSGAKNIGLKSGSAPSPTRLRQIALVAKDLERAKCLLPVQTHVIGTEVIYEDPTLRQWGLKNFLIPLGGDFIEIVSPVKPNTTAGRLLSKRGDGGYMIIMQTEDARKRRDFIKSKGLAKLILTHEHDGVVCTQYHPKGFKGRLPRLVSCCRLQRSGGGMIPELDSHDITTDDPKPLTARFLPWHACGPNYKAYYSGMQRSSHFSLEGAVCRLEPGDVGHEAAAKQWEDIFGVTRSRDLLAFTNARLGFIRGLEGQPEGLASITVGVNGKDKLAGILERASEKGLCGDGWINMIGVKWYFVLTGVGDSKGKL
ncbi:hypothetical protein GQ43DRAFT_432638 [Delitschia confertaspora ATCC 74209]|uniref:Glyoxalase-like domain-containing protein n=1 Tax=Delitschia confertaspora ATCC 74209 TaxID=1513339 RepID=A0A9P4MRD3_9PLEO|nr:hypothetical protein GQ43DRAFT_432638 [Delitschia confertaspora ATCC 74209]